MMDVPKCANEFSFNGSVILFKIWTGRSWRTDSWTTSTCWAAVCVPAAVSRESACLPYVLVVRGGRSRRSLPRRWLDSPGNSKGSTIRSARWRKWNKTSWSQTTSSLTNLCRHCWPALVWPVIGLMQEESGKDLSTHQQFSSIQNIRRQFNYLLLDFNLIMMIRIHLGTTRIRRSLCGSTKKITLASSLCKKVATWLPCSEGSVRASPKYVSLHLQ